MSTHAFHDFVDLRYPSEENFAYQAPFQTLFKPVTNT